MYTLRSMSVEEFSAFQRQFDDSFLTHAYHQWAYSDDMWGDFLFLFCSV